MAKPTVFIGSSVEHKKLAEAVQSLLDYDVTPVIWTQGTFEPSHSPLESLEVSLEKVDFAILICAPEDNDVTIKRGQEYRTIRDNIIFELGLFIGRLGRKRTFLISPRDVDLNLPSDLAGIFPETYDSALLKDNPEAALGPACGKIKRTISKIGPVARVDVAEVKEEAKESEADIQVSRIAENEPKSNWSLSDYEWKYFLAHIVKDTDNAALIDNAFGNTEYAASEEDKAYWEAWKQYTALESGETGNLGLVRSYSERFPESSRLKEILARFIDHYGDHEQAAILLDQALEKADSTELACRIVNRAVLIQSAPVPQSRISTYLTKLNSLPRQAHEDKVKYLKAVHTLAQAAGLDEIAKTISETVLTLQPDDVNSRFKLAYDYSESGQNDLALLHYDAIPHPERSGTAWNNLGVTYSRNQIRGLAVNAYREASKKGETIADGNLAQLFLGAGFFEEARLQAEAAVAKPDHDKLAVTALSSLADAATKEATLRDAALTKGSTRQKVRRAIGQMAFAFTGHDIEGNWSIPEGTLKLTSSGTASYSGFLEFVRERIREGLGLIGKSVVQERVQITVELRRFGSALEGTIIRETPDSYQSLLGSIGRERRVLLSVSEDGESISGIELDFEETAIHWTRERTLKAIH